MIPAPIIVATSLLYSGWLMGKRRVAVIIRLVIIMVIIHKTYAALVRI